MPDLLPCRLCGFLGLTVAVELTGMPRWNHRLLREHELASDRPVDLRVHRCPSCGFVSVAMQLADDYYDDYVNAPSLSPQAQQFQREQAVEFVERFGLKGSRVLEVGCGDGFFLHAVQQAGAAGFGVEPSVAQRALACARGLDVEPGILSGSRRMQAAPFDAVAGNGDAQCIQDRGDHIHAFHETIVGGSTRGIRLRSRVDHDEGHALHGVVEEFFFTEPVIAQKVAVVGTKDDEGVIQATHLIHFLEESAQFIIELFDESLVGRAHVPDHFVSRKGLALFVLAISRHDGVSAKKF